MLLARRAQRADDEMRAHFETHAAHADRMADAFLRVVDDVFLRDRMQDPLVARDRHSLRRLQHAIHVGVGHLAVLDRHDARRVLALRVRARDRRVHAADLAAGHQLGFLDRALDRLHGGFDVDHHAALEPARFVAADADHLDRVARRILADQGHHLGGADVEADDEGLVAFAVHSVLSSAHVSAKPFV